MCIYGVSSILKRIKKHKNCQKRFNVERVCEKSSYIIYVIYNVKVSEKEEIEEERDPKTLISNHPSGLNFLNNF